MRKPFAAATLSATSLIAFFASAPLTAQPNSPDPKCMAGVYTLEEFKRDGEVFRPPQVSGSWVVLNGAVVWIFNDRTQASKQTNFAGVGHYAISETAYSYQYDEIEVFTQTDTGITVSRKLPWEGMRPYTPVQEADGVHLQNAESRTDFVCSADGAPAPDTWAKASRLIKLVGSIPEIWKEFASVRCVTEYSQFKVL